MKLFLLSLIPFLIITGACKAQWTTSGTNIYNSNTGNVGIGTTTPARKLTINGTSNPLIGFNLSETEKLIFGLVSSSGSGFSGTAAGDAVLRAIGNIAIGGGYPGIATPSLYLSTAGNIGIGTTTPSEKLSVIGNGIVGTSGALSNFANTFGITNYFAVVGSNDGDKTGFILGNRDGTNNRRAAIYLDTSFPAVVFDDSYGAGGRPNWVFKTGNVGIGTTTPDQKLSVNGTIHSKSVLVDLTGWSDFVFKPTYHLRPLAEVKAYIAKNHHLPDVPAAAEVEKKGLDVGEMNKILMQKVEELTLYLIEQQKINASLQKQINELKAH